LRSAAVERVSERVNDALRLLIEAAPLFEASDNHALKAGFYDEYAQVLAKLGRAESRRDYIDRALVEYAAASYHFEQAGHARAQAFVENNLGLLFGTIKRFAEAHERLDRAQALFTSLKDKAHLAQVDDTRARVLLEEGHIHEAEKFARAAVQALDAGDRQSLLAEALTTHGLALVRAGRDKEGQSVLQRALEVAERACDTERAGQAALTMVEESGERLTVDELSVIYERALDLLAASRDHATKDRLLSCARRVLLLAGIVPTPQTWENFSLKDALRRYEARIIERALKDADRSVTRASRMLGFRNHTSLIKKLNTWHEHLLSERAPARERRQSLMFINDALADARPVSILHVEDNRMVANAVKETLEMEGWTVESLSDGEAAWQSLSSESHYDVLIFDNDLPGIDGLELVSRTRRIPQRQQTPIIMLSASDVEREARREGVSAFLRKPEEILLVTETIARLLARKLRQR
jgi:CheY-like chemotaxis protein/tetratricopeptide (TPR) repeat protein